ncbi:MAG: carboxypeptidase regulatory-like domain-containing protein [Labilithrix sp.]|nr:carboxypeptidase regulatory-like domain-containing protein [Labilithrix sp.]
MRITGAIASLLVLPLLAFACEKDDAGAGSDAGTPGFGPVSDAADDPNCVNLCKQQVFCPDAVTTLSGSVKDPSGRYPVYNAIVYIPNAPTSPIVSGPSCDRCGSVSGDPLVATITNAHGRFVLKDVPAGEDIPLVVQVGKWRRQLVVPKIIGCAVTPLTDIRLPRNHCEGDIPRIALATGGEDTMECWLRKVGLDDSEFTTEAGPGRIHLYAGSGTERTTAFDTAHGGQTLTDAEALWSDPARLSLYDLVLLSCEGEPFPAKKPPAALAAMKAFTSSGGRVLASHWHRYWWSTQGAPPSPFASFATWNDRVDPPADLDGTIDLSLPKGKAMRFWLEDKAVDAVDSTGHLSMKSAHHTVDAVDQTRAIPWVTFENANAIGQAGVALLSANMPSDAPEDQHCGRVAYTALHASASDVPGPPWPMGCALQEMTPEERALEFLLFDVASCVLSDRTAPAPPHASTAPPEGGRDDSGPVAVQTPVTRGPCDD